MPADTTPYIVSRSHSGALYARVYALVGALLGVTAFSAHWGMAHPLFVERHFWFIVIATFAGIFLLRAVRAVSILGLGVAAGISGALGLEVSPLVGHFLAVNPALVGNVAVSTAALFGGLSLYAAFSRRNFQALSGFLVAGVLLAVVSTLVNIFWLHNPALQSAIEGVVVLAFSGLILVDTQRIMSASSTPGGAISVAVGLYLDILNIFIALLEIFGGGRK